MGEALGVCEALSEVRETLASQHPTLPLIMLGGGWAEWGGVRGRDHVVEA
eukprot:COSAG04_NODE_23652_length_334_cov_2.391489_1_plen_49_part_10